MAILGAIPGSGATTIIFRIYIVPFLWRLHRDIADLRARTDDQLTDLRGRIEDQVGDLRARMARLEGLFEGFTGANSKAGP